MGKKDDLGDRMKDYESRETGRRFIPLLPIYARIDGKGFSKFTKGMARPFDPRMTDAMIQTMEHLVKETHALVGYTQSDEISLIWFSDDYDKEMFFDGKVQKLASVLPSLAAARFAQIIRGWQPYEDRIGAFDCRVFQLPNTVEATNAILWRAIDCTKNAVSMAARAHFSHRELQGKSGQMMREMMAAKGVDFDAYDPRFRFGTFARRKKEIVGTADDDQPIIRSRMATFNVPFRNVTNRTEVLFDGADPILRPIIAEAA